MTSPADRDDLTARYRRFAEREAARHSPLYEALSRGVAGDPAVLEILEVLPPTRQQPNLLFAAVRHVCGVPADFDDFKAKLLDRTQDVLATMGARSTQTNEAGRCAILLPILARMHQPLALIEAGASAGLCLIPDQYAYEYNGTRIGRQDATAVFPCRANDATPIPTRMPTISWRAGMDLSPVSLRDSDQVAWLETLVWPDQPDRLARLRAAIATARYNPVRLRQGDILTDLEALIAEAPTGPTLTVFHCAVLAYVTDPAAREAFVTMLWDSGATWISLETPGVFPEIAARAPRRGPPGAFLASVNGEPVAWADPHGGWIDWFVN